MFPVDFDIGDVVLKDSGDIDLNKEAVNIIIRQALQSTHELLLSRS
jgi:hypothetical protein